ncbi:MAG: PEP-CTERM sorting domain-containing protein [Planctomycetota bacterium]|jgi:hypothetical protein
MFLFLGAARYHCPTLAPVGYQCTKIVTGYSQAAVPEPTSMAIFGLGALGFANRSRRKDKV